MGNRLSRTVRRVVRPWKAVLGGGSGAQGTAAREGLDRNYHWLTLLDRRLQEHVADTQGRLGGLEAALGRVEGTLAQLGRDLRGGLEPKLDGVCHTLAAVAEQVAWSGAPEPLADGPLVSVICPSFNRAHVIDRALGSLRAQTYPRWECLLVDDGSDDLDDVAVRRLQSDARVRVIPLGEHRGAPAARNRGLAEAAGEIVAYLDSDNTWHPTYLARVIDVLAARPEAGWTVASQLVVGDGMLGIRPDRHGIDRLGQANFIDLNAVAHRRSLLSETPGPEDFDESFERLSDWELVERLARTAGEPARIAAVGSIYHEDLPDRITRQVPLHPHLERLRARGRGRPAEGLRVLAAEWHYPQASEQYVRSDIVGLQTLGAHVEAWSQEDVAVAYESSVPLHRGELVAAIAATRPDVVVTHWLQMGAAYRDTVRRAGVPFAIRGHGFDYDPALVDRLLAQPGVVVHLFPHIEAAYAKPHPRLRSLPIAFDQDRFPPTASKDRRVVVRTGVALHTKDYDSFFEAAKRCPEHRFVLVLCTAYRVEHQLDEIVARCDELAAPVEILVDAQPEKAAELVRQAGIYLHTHGDTHAYGMSVSIAEALGTGCYVLARDLPGMAGFVGGAGALYRDADHAAALIQQTTHWSDDRWAQVWRTASDYAHERFGAADVAATMVQQWREVLGLQVVA